MNQFFVVFGTDKPGTQATRLRLRPWHRAHLRAPGRHEVIVRLGGPTLEESGQAMNGTLLVIEAAEQGDVEAFMRDDPYVQAEMFSRLEIRLWNWSLGNPEVRGQA
ncbi:YciI family protein [Pseudomonas sp. NPDC087358]|uniref:YciI family protein n=1 Tax=Pseudomonas sp. NPDC087358 TaxID=3364439 RepID=UPI00384D4862